jgi:hypothetical protein
MKIILSRKGIDDKYGGGYSPILPDRSMMSIPIPQAEGTGVPYKDLIWKGKRMTDYFDLLKIKMNGSDDCHLDPDLRPSHEVHDKRWKGCFGQAGAAMTQLVNQKVDVGDLFLFFGNFRNTDLDSEGQLKVEPQHTKHVLFGYLQIGEIIQGDDLTRADILEVYSEHPHIKNAEDYSPNNILYIASDRLTDTSLPGWGTFTYSAELDLTKPGYRKSIWQLPEFFHHKYGTEISYHGNHDRFRLVDDTILLETVAMGQDFVVSPSKDVEEWALSLIKSHAVKRY